VAEKINKNERKNRSEIVNEDAQEFNEICKILGVPEGEPIPELTVSIRHFFYLLKQVTAEEAPINNQKL